MPYIGYLVRGEMPFIEDPRGMSATGLVLGVGPYLAISWGDSFDRAGKLVGTEVVQKTMALAATK